MQKRDSESTYNESHLYYLNLQQSQFIIITAFCVNSILTAIRLYNGSVYIHKQTKCNSQYEETLINFFLFGLLWSDKKFSKFNIYFAFSSQCFGVDAKMFVVKDIYIYKKEGIPVYSKPCLLSQFYRHEILKYKLHVISHTMFICFQTDRDGRMNNSYTEGIILHNFNF